MKEDVKTRCEKQTKIFMTCSCSSQKPHLISDDLSPARVVAHHRDHGNFVPNLKQREKKKKKKKKSKQHLFNATKPNQNKIAIFRLSQNKIFHISYTTKRFTSLIQQNISYLTLKQNISHLSLKTTQNKTTQHIISHLSLKTKTKQNKTFHISLTMVSNSAIENPHAPSPQMIHNSFSKKN